MHAFSNITPIHTVFYTVFHPTEGTKICFEFPPNNLAKSKINFDTIKNYIIPKPQLCNKLLTLKHKTYRIVGYPVNVKASYYARNSFNFNVVFVFPYDKQTTPYEPSIERLGKMFGVLEEQSQILSKAEKDPVYYQLKSDTSAGNDANSSNVESTVEKYAELIKAVTSGEKQLSVPDFLTKMFQDLNNYSECLIPIDSGNSIDIKLFTMNPSPTTSISIEDVPITTVNLMKFVNSNWDPTMLKIVPFVNGVNSIARIAKFSDSDIGLAIECINHLIYYDCVSIVDIFQFSNVYAPREGLSRFLTDRVLATECQKYIISTDSQMLNLEFFTRESYSQKRPSYSNQNSSYSSTGFRKRVPSTSSGNSNSSLNNNGKNMKSNSSFNLSGKGSSAVEELEEGSVVTLPTKACIFELYRGLSQGQPLSEWYQTNISTIRNNCIDIRKFIVFGVTRGLIYRCITYPVLKNSSDILDITARNIKIKIDKLRKRKTVNLFSTADIKPDMETNPTKNKAFTKYSDNSSTSTVMNSSKKKKRASGSELNPDSIADELLKEVYQKLTLQTQSNLPIEPQANSTVTNPKSILYITQSNNSGVLSLERKKRNSNSTIRSKVFFDTTSNNDEALIDSVSIHTGANQVAQQQREEQLQQEILTLVNCLRNADSLDRICTKLEKSREDVELMLKSIGSYNLVNA